MLYQGVLRRSSTRFSANIAFVLVLKTMILLSTTTSYPCSKIVQVAVYPSKTMLIRGSRIRAQEILEVSFHRWK